MGECYLYRVVASINEIATVACRQPRNDFYSYATAEFFRFAMTGI